ncbi:Biofilm regulatory protein A [bacterium HR29]|nr:Biofilm regulatory protein A [bacterium HR29]
MGTRQRIRRVGAAAAIFLGAALAVYLSLLTFTRIDRYVLPGNEAAVPSVPIFVPGTNLGASVSVPGVPAPDEQVWKPSDRINILVMGLDRRPYEPPDSPARSDTMFIASIDTFHGRLQMLAIPRDFWTEVPYGSDEFWVEAKINAAFSYGISQRYPGGGPAAAIATVQRTFGIRIHHYVVVDWTGFVRLIDALGGIEVNVPETISDWGTDVLEIFPNRTVTAGLHHFDGQQALAYSRTRADGDLKRIERQQLVIRAAIAKALSLGWLTRIPELWSAYRDAVQTDIDTGLIPGYALLAQRLDYERIETYSLGPATYGSISEDGQLILLPRWDQVYAIIDEFLADPLTRDERPVIALEYPPGAEELAAQVRQRLEQYGVPPQYIRLVNGASGPPGVVDLTGKPYTARKLARLTNLRMLDRGSEHVDGIDVIVRIGDGMRLSP